MANPEKRTTPLLTADDLEIGEVYDIGTYTPTRADIIEFAERWDPQPFHTDLDASRAGYFGDVIASGAHTIAIYQRLAVAGIYSKWDVLAGRRLLDVEFHRPVRPGSPLGGRVTIASVDLSDTRRAPVLLHSELRDADSNVVLSLDVDVLIWRKSGGSQTTHH